MQKKKKNLDTDLTLCTKKWIRDINVKQKTVKLIEDTIGELLHDFGYGIVSLDP